jgi:hypothetical protein
MPAFPNPKMIPFCPLMRFLIYMQESLGKNCFAIFNAGKGTFFPTTPGNTFDLNRFYLYDQCGAARDHCIL